MQITTVESFHLYITAVVMSPVKSQKVGMYEIVN